MSGEDDIQALPDSLPDIKFNLEAQEQFGNDKGIILEHWAAIPSTIGQKDRGDLRRPDKLDTISENGYIYKKMGDFVGTILGNGKKNNHAEGGIIDQSIARLMMPRHYADNPNKEIALLPGDRLYAKQIELKVPNYQKVEFQPKAVDVLQFPAKSVVFMRDSQNIEYLEGIDFKLNNDGDIEWIPGRPNPGIDPETGRGRLYGIRYMYIAFWYVHELINEIRVTNTSDASAPARLPYHAKIQREYVYKQKNRGDKQETTAQEETQRTHEAPTETINPEQYEVKVDVRNFED